MCNDLKTKYNLLKKAINWCIRVASSISKRFKTEDLFIYYLSICLFLYLFIYLFISLFTYLFFVFMLNLVS